MGTMGRRKVLDLKNIITMIPGGPKGPEVGVPKVIELTERLRWIERKKKEMLMKKMLLRVLLTQDLKQIHPLIKIIVVKMRKILTRLLKKMIQVKKVMRV